MDSVNVITVKDGIVEEIKSFVADENMLSKKAVKYFAEKCREYALEDIEIDSCLEDGYYCGGNFSINITWSEVLK